MSGRKSVLITEDREVSMKKILLPAILVAAFGTIGSICGTCADGNCVYFNANAQVSRGPVAPKRDPQLEKEGDHQLDVAWQYFKRKVNKNDKEALARLDKAILGRLEQVYAENPLYSKIDEVLYLTALVYARDENFEDARKYFDLVIKSYPESRWVKDSEKQLASLKDAEKNAAGVKQKKSEKDSGSGRKDS